MSQRTTGLVMIIIVVISVIGGLTGAYMADRARGITVDRSLRDWGL